MGRGKSVTKALLDASQAALLAGIEIHNKPQIAYRYPTAVILIVNAWELALKAYVYKYIGKKCIYETRKEKGKEKEKEKESKHTISFSDACKLVEKPLVPIDKNYQAVFENLTILNEYRCECVHFANTKLDPIVFMLMVKAVLNYSSFLGRHFGKDIAAVDNLVISPIGFKLPLDPVDYLKQNSEKAKNEFVNRVLDTIKELNANSISESILVGFDIHFESVKKINNADLIAGIDQDNGTVTFSKSVRVTDDPKAPAVRVVPDFPPLRYPELQKKLKAQAPEIKFDKRFNAIMHEVKKMKRFCTVNYLDPHKKSGSERAFYTEDTVDYVIDEYCSGKSY